MKRALVVGCGYTGMRLAARLREMDVRVVATTRRASRGAELEAAGIEPLVGELGAKETLRRIDELGPELVAYFVPPGGEDDPLTKILAATARAPLEAFLYASSTAVYGDRGGDWVDETSMVQPESPEAEARHAAERICVEAAWSYQTPTRICRITGIYGPGRTLKKALASGDYVLIAGHDSWVSRIHVDDLVSGLLAAWTKGGDGRVYNLVDDEPHRASEFANLAADLQGLPRPEWVEESEARRRLGEQRLRRKLANKRVRSLRLKDDLLVELKYPSYTLGLPAAVAEGGQAR
ncbi:MAG: NAD-dependent epimerase/dehydratase family protein [Gemmatimonadetes bacterium]|nr:NAD-dependent epimerase/dehydratase family protein [Gemmatimonadota bacterium]NIO31001.1 NAD-dependent epimerase/dehydratase family protein [Gemmatimonadota bacterium]